MMTGFHVLLSCAEWVRACLAAERLEDRPSGLPDPTTDPEGFRVAVHQLVAASPGLTIGRDSASGGIEFVPATEALRESEAEFARAVELAQAAPAVAANMLEEMGS